MIPAAELRLAAAGGGLDPAEDGRKAFGEIVAVHRFVPATEACVGAERGANQRPEFRRRVLDHLP